MQILNQIIRRTREFSRRLLAPSRWRARWVRVLALSALVQGVLVLIAWHTWQSHHQSPANTAIAIEPMSSSAIDATHAANPVASSEPEHTTAKTTETAQKGAQPLTSPTPKTATAKSPIASAAQNTKTAQSNARSPERADSDLWSLPIPLQTLSYKAHISNGEIEQDLQPARLLVKALGDQRYEVTLSNKQLDTRNGNIGFHSAFVTSAVGPQITSIGGGAYLKTAANPKGFNLGGLRLNPSTSNSENPNAYSHFLERSSLIIYLQGALMDKRIHPPQKLQLPIYGHGGVRMQTVSIAADNPRSGSCRSCVRASVAGDLGEARQWSIWYDGARNWQPVFMQMHLGKSGEWVLTLTIQP